MARQIVKNLIILLIFLVTQNSFSQGVLKKIGNNNILKIDASNKDFKAPLLIINDIVYAIPDECLESRIIKGDTENRKIEGNIEDRKIGGDIEKRKIDGDIESRKIGGDIEDRKIDGSVEKRKISGDVEDRKIDGNVEKRKIGGDVEDRKIGGDIENRKIGGDVEDRKINGNVENRKIGGDVEDRKIGGDISIIKCKKIENERGFNLIGINSNSVIKLYYQQKVRIIQGLKINY